MRKRQTREHVIADLSANHVERWFLLSGHVAERVQFDYGYDLFVQTFNAQGELEADFLLIQLKATDAPRRVRQGSELALTLERRDIEAWLLNRVPVFVILYDATQDAAYWRRVDASWMGPPAEAESSTVTVRIAVANMLDKTGVNKIRRIKNDEASGK